MSSKHRSDDRHLQDAIGGLLRGDFSRLEALFAPGVAPGQAPQILKWLEAGRLQDPVVLAEALTCACFLGRVEVAARLLAAGVPPPVAKGPA